jgi:hypothetical protein
MTLETAALAAVDDEVELVALGATAAEDRGVESDKTRIRRIIAFAAADGAAVGAGVVWIRLYGSGIDGNPPKFMIGGYGGTLITTGGQSVVVMEWTDLDVKVRAGSDIQVGAEMNLDLGTVAVGVTIELE